MTCFGDLGVLLGLSILLLGFELYTFSGVAVYIYYIQYMFGNSSSFWKMDLGCGPHFILVL